MQALQLFDCCKDKVTIFKLAQLSFQLSQGTLSLIFERIKWQKKGIMAINSLVKPTRSNESLLGLEITLPYLNVSACVSS